MNQWDRDSCNDRWHLTGLTKEDLFEKGDPSTAPFGRGSFKR